MFAFLEEYFTTKFLKHTLHDFELCAFFSWEASSEERDDSEIWFLRWSDGKSIHGRQWLMLWGNHLWTSWVWMSVSEIVQKIRFLRKDLRVTRNWKTKHIDQKSKVHALIIDCRFRDFEWSIQLIKLWNINDVDVVKILLCSIKRIRQSNYDRISRRQFKVSIDSASVDEDEEQMKIISDVFQWVIMSPILIVQQHQIVKNRSWWAW